MALELRQSLSLSQQLIMTPQLQQAIKLLQLSRLELLETISHEMEENPVLEELISDGDEEEDRAEKKKDQVEVEKDTAELPEVRVEERAREDADWENYLSEYNTSGSGSTFEERELPSIDNVTSVGNNLYSHFMWQLNMGNFDEQQKEIGVHICGNLNDDGYLTVSVEELAEITGYSQEKVLKVLHSIQKFDPVGIAARNTRECLLIQIEFQGLSNTLVEKIIKDCLGELELKKYNLIAKKLFASIEEVLAAISVIQGLEPKPGRGYLGDSTIYITPDIYVIKVGDDYEILQNEDGLHKLRINAYYKDILSSKGLISEDARVYIKDKLRSAAWLIKSIHQRQKTIHLVTESIVRFQKDFLDNGITRLKPLVLRDVAEDIEMHESTISRVTTNKYVHTPQGIFELKYFFNSFINKVDGDAIASESVKEYIRNIIKAENKAKPSSDQEIVDILKKMNIKIARRTIAKYRESMHILSSRKRKNIY